MAGSEIYKICERIERIARREINKFRQQQGLPPQSSNAPVIAPKKSLRGISEIAEPSDQVTVDMKMEFCSKVKKLTPDGLIKLV